MAEAVQLSRRGEGVTRLPDFLIVGALRSGTTTLFRHLADHPQVFAARPKEVRFFDRNYQQGVAWYAEHFTAARPDQRAGEASPRYWNRPVTIERMASLVPEARLIAILRDPVDRAYSEYWMHRIQGRTDSTFEQYLSDSPHLLDSSRYIDKVHSLCERFSRDQLLVLFFEELRDEALATCATAYRHIGVDEGHRPSSLGRIFNPYVEFRSLRVRRWARSAPRALKLMRRVVEKLNTKMNVSYPAMSPETHQWLTAYFAEPNRELATWLGRTLPDWSLSSEDLGDGQDPLLR